MDLLRFLVTNNGKSDQLKQKRNLLKGSWELITTALGKPGRANGQKPRQAGQLEPQGQLDGMLLLALLPCAALPWVLASLAPDVGPSSCLSASHGSQ